MIIIIIITISLLLCQIIRLSDSFAIQRPLQVFDSSKSSSNLLRPPDWPAQLWTLQFSTNNNNNNNNDDDKRAIDWDGIGASQWDKERDKGDDVDKMIPAVNQVVDTTTKTINDDDDDDDNDGIKNRQTWMSPSSSSLFSSTSQTQSSSSSTTTRSNRNGVIVDEREVQLVSLFERTLPIQVVVLLAILCFTIYIGWSGGITDGSDRYTYNIDGNEDIDTTILLEPEISSYLQQQQQQQLDTSEIGPSVFL
jgi:hypothetical protein